MTLFLTVLLLVAPALASADMLLWTYTGPAPATVTVERATVEAGPYNLVATIPSLPAQFMLTPGQWGFYRVRNATQTSNSVNYSLGTNTALTVRIDALEARVILLEAPGTGTLPPVTVPGNLSSRVIDADHLEIVGTGCLSLRTTGTGLRRIVECVH